MLYSHPILRTLFLLLALTCCFMLFSCSTEDDTAAETELSQTGESLPVYDSIVK